MNTQRAKQLVQASGITLLLAGATTPYFTGKALLPRKSPVDQIAFADKEKQIYSELAFAGIATAGIVAAAAGAYLVCRPYTFVDALDNFLTGEESSDQDELLQTPVSRDQTPPYSAPHL